MVDREQLLIDGPVAAAHRVVLAHGAGAPMDSPFMEHVARGLAACGLRVVRFEFPYMRRCREVGRSGRPDSTDLLIERWRAVLDYLNEPEETIIGGKSLGGRIASMIAEEAGVAGLVCLGYPFHPPGRPDRLRTAHLNALCTPTLILQGTRDPFGLPEEIETYGLSTFIRVAFLEDGDHSFKPRVRSGRTLEQNLDEAVGAIAHFIDEL